MNSKHLRDQDITLNKDGAAGEKTEIVYSCAGPRIVPEERDKVTELLSHYKTPNQRDGSNGWVFE